LSTATWGATPLPACAASVTVVSAIAIVIAVILFIL
jgi:hypothetical protein